MRYFNRTCDKDNLSIKYKMATITELRLRILLTDIVNSYLNGLPGLVYLCTHAPGQMKVPKASWSRVGLLHVT